MSGSPQIFVNLHTTPHGLKASGIHQAIASDSSRPNDGRCLDLFIRCQDNAFRSAFLDRRSYLEGNSLLLKNIHSVFHQFWIKAWKSRWSGFHIINMYQSRINIILLA
ncbi:hypothetical protein D3C81_1032030 [compost metagenome]